jgi:hypothetical protein
MQLALVPRPGSAGELLAGAGERAEMDKHFAVRLLVGAGDAGGQPWVVKYQGYEHDWLARESG